MKPIFLILLIFTSFYAAGQNYQCIQNGPKHYFNNSAGYLRGMRIDSVRTYPDSTIYYPFKTQRGNASTVGGGGGSSMLFVGGSWLGEKIIELPDGTFLFSNIRHDTVVIRTQANVGDSWLLFRDSADIYYRAYVVSKSTRSIYGTTDSVKVIQLKAFHRDTGYIPSSPINNLKITLSKNYGFYEIFDLYLFPHAFLTSFSFSSPLTVTDYFFRNCGPQQFRHVVVNSERDSDLHNYQVGDILCHTTYCTPIFVGGYIMLDTIVAKTPVSSTNTLYTIHRRTKADCTPFSPPTYTYSADNILAHPGLLNYVDTVKMPEEYGIETMYYYDPADTSFCFTSPRYWWRRGALFNEFEPCESGASYKMGLGMTNFYTCGNYDSYERVTYGGGMFYVRKNNIYCNISSPIPNVIPAISGISPEVVITPNPANNELSIATPATGKYSISLTDMLGRQVLVIESDKEVTCINTRQYPSGLYIITLRDSSGNTINQKVSITH